MCYNTDATIHTHTRTHTHTHTHTPRVQVRFDFFCKAALEFLLRSGRQPDILHCHDWSTAHVAKVRKNNMYKCGCGFEEEQHVQVWVWV